jgi:hypothetical protein
MHQHHLGSTSSRYFYGAQKTRPDAQLNFVRNRAGHRHNVHYWTTRWFIFFVTPTNTFGLAAWDMVGHGLGGGTWHGRGVPCCACGWA